MPTSINVKGEMDYLGNDTFLCTFSNYDYGVIEIPFDLTENGIKGFILNVPNFEDTNYYFEKIR